MSPDGGTAPVRPAIVGLTGGIACGKSEVARVLAGEGVPVLETDEVAHEEMRPGGAAYEEVVEAFGREMLAADGTIDRVKLSRWVFENPAALRRLNALVHPCVRERWEAWRAALRREGRPGIVVIPLLYETGATVGWDAVLCVAAPEALVLERLSNRGLNQAEAKQRIGAQWPIEEKMRRADVVIWNDGTLEQLKAKSATAWRQVTGGE